MEWEGRETFGKWLRMQRVVEKEISQEDLAELLGVHQSRVSRWEKRHLNTDPPTLEECAILADIFEVDFIELAKLCDRWNDDLQRRVLVSLASGPDLSNAPVAQLDQTVVDITGSFVTVDLVDVPAA